MKTGKQNLIGGFGGGIVGRTGTDRFAILFGGTVGTGGDKVAVAG